MASLPAVGVITIPRGFLPNIRGGTVIAPTTSKIELNKRIEKLEMDYLVEYHKVII